MNDLQGYSFEPLCSTSTQVSAHDNNVQDTIPEPGQSAINSSSPSPEATAPPYESRKRAKTGCMTCRIRKKRCDEGKPNCAACARLGIDCLGYGKKRPGWSKVDDNAKRLREDIYAKVNTRRVGRRSVDRRAGDFTGISLPGEVSVGDGGQWSMETFLRGLGELETGNVGALGGQDTDQWRWNLADGYGDETLGIDGNSTFADSLHIDPQVTSPAMEDGSPPALPSGMTLHLPTGSATLGSPANDTFGDIWNTLFGDAPPAFAQRTPTPPIPQLTIPPVPSPSLDPSYLSYPAPHTSDSQTYNLRYLHHYLNVVLPLQYRFVGMPIGDYITPLALSRPAVHTSVSSLAALHLAVRSKKAPLSRPCSPPYHPLPPGTIQDEDARVATVSHRESITRIRFLSSGDLTAEEVVVTALFAISYHLFSGGILNQWREALGTAQRCLRAAVDASPELNDEVPRMSDGSRIASPWKRYQSLMRVMVWMDIFGSVTMNQASRLLPTYRKLLKHDTVRTPERVRLSMEHVMGCDDTTLLAIAETTALMEWREYAENAGCLSISELVRRGSIIEKLLKERRWTESHLDYAGTSSEINQQVTTQHESVHQSSRNNQFGFGKDQARTIRCMSDVFHAGAKVLLAVAVNGPFPRVPEVATAVSEVISALHSLDTLYISSDINRALILPITIGGCHCETTAQQAFFRSRLAELGEEAAAFGNSRQALQLMEEVWRKRSAGVERLCWRGTTKDLGWDAGILLI